MLCAFSAHMNSLGSRASKIESVTGTYPSHTTRHNPHPGRVPERGRPVPADRLFACQSLPSPSTGPLLEECLLPAVHKAKTLDVKVVRPTAHLRVILHTSLLAVAWASIRPDWASASRRNLDSRLTPARRGRYPPIDKPRCTYYLGACLEQGKKATRLKQEPPRSRTLLPNRQCCLLLLLSISKRL